MPTSAQDPERFAYLPPRAARARKLILRTRLGVPWMAAAVLFALLILIAGAVLVARGGRPGPPWVRVAPLERLPEGAVSEVPGPAGQVVVVDRRNDELRVFLGPAGRCPVTARGAGYARACQGQAWDADGAPGRAGQPALGRVPVTLAGGDLYVDPRAQSSHSTSRTSSSPASSSTRRSGT